MSISIVVSSLETSYNLTTYKNYYDNDLDLNSCRLSLEVLLFGLTFITFYEFEIDFDVVQLLSKLTWWWPLSKAETIVVSSLETSYNLTPSPSPSPLKQLDEQVYQRLHQKLLYQHTRQEIKLKDSKKTNLFLYPPVLQTNSWDRKVMYPCYTFQSGPVTQFPQEFYKWWKKHYQYQGSPANKIKVRLITTTNPTLRSLLIHKKPPREILTRMEPSVLRERLFLIPIPYSHSLKKNFCSHSLFPIP